MDADFVFVYTRPGLRSVTQLPPCEKPDWLEETYMDYIFALMRFVLLAIT